MRRVFLFFWLLTLWPVPLFAEEETPPQPAVPVEERLKALEKRLDSLEKVEVVKQVTEYVCPDGSLYDEPHDCPEGGMTLERLSFRKMKFSRRESLAEKIGAVVEQSQRLKLGGSARGILQGVIGTDHDDQLSATGALDLYFLPRLFLSLSCLSISNRSAAGVRTRPLEVSPVSIRRLKRSA